jgi:hypothetical protein
MCEEAVRALQMERLVHNEPTVAHYSLRVTVGVTTHFPNFIHPRMRCVPKLRNFKLHRANKVFTYSELLPNMLNNV